MNERDLRLIGLGARAGSVLVGTSRVREGLKTGTVRLVVLASDRGDRTEQKVARLARGRGVTILEGPGSAELGRKLGREEVQAVGLLDPHLSIEMCRSSEQRATRRI